MVTPTTPASAIQLNSPNAPAPAQRTNLGQVDSEECPPFAAAEAPEAHIPITSTSTGMSTLAAKLVNQISSLENTTHRSLHL